MTKSELPAQTAGLFLRFQVTKIMDNGKRTSGRVLTAAATREEAIEWMQAKRTQVARQTGVVKVIVKFVRIEA